MKRGDDTKLFAYVAVLFAVLAGFCYGYYLPYGTRHDEANLLQSTYDGVAADPINAHEAKFGFVFFALMAVLTLVFALDELSNRRIAQATVS